MNSIRKIRPEAQLKKSACEEGKLSHKNMKNEITYIVIGKIEIKEKLEG